MSENMPEQGARRGRRSTELEQTLEAEDEEYAVHDVGLLSEGDTIIGRITLQHNTAVGDGWFTYGAQTRVRPGESDEEAGARVAAFVTDNTYELIHTVTEQIEEAVREQNEERRQRRNPRALRRN